MTIQEEPVAPERVGAQEGMAGALAEVAVWAERVDREARWPGEALAALSRVGGTGWVIPTEYGGSPLSAAELVEKYARTAEACLVTAFVLTQRNGACQRIADGQSQRLKAELLPGLARGHLFATVGISHLTTSRQHWQQPTVSATPLPGGGFRMDGEVPWVTGAPFADVVVTGGVLPDGRQILAAVSSRSAGFFVRPSAGLLALSGSHTSSVVLDGVEIEADHVIAGPVEQVMRRASGGGAGSLATSALAVGVARRAVVHLEAEARRRDELWDTVGPLRQDLDGLADAVARAAVGPALRLDPAVLRTRANSLVLRSTQAWLAASKGAGYVQGHPAERSVREALFFLVWSCPQPVLSAALRELAFARSDL